MTRNRSGLASSCFGTPGTNAANLSAGLSTRSGTCIKRTRFTGPSTRYRSSAASWNCSRRNCSSSAGMLSATSTRTESPKWRCESSPASAVRRFLISSSSRNKSLLRVTRNGSPVRSCPERAPARSEEHTSELQSQSNLVCRLLLEKKKNILIVALIENVKKKLSTVLSPLALIAAVGLRTHCYPRQLPQLISCCACCAHIPHIFHIL